MKSVLEKQRIETLRGKIENKLPHKALKVFLRWEPEDINYIEFNREGNFLDIPSELLELADCGLIEKYGTCCEDVWYSLSNDGRKLQHAMTINGSNLS